MATTETEAADEMDLYLSPVLIVTGSVCNVLVILVMRAPFFSHVSTSLYMSVNALVDNISLLVALPFHWLHVNYPKTIYRGDHSDAICKFLHFTGWCTSDMGIALTVAMTFERAFAVKFPLKAASFCTRKRARCIIICIFFLTFAKDGHFILKSQMVDINVTSYLCELNADDEAFYRFAVQVWPIFHNVFVFVSFGIIIASNVIIIKNVRETAMFKATLKTNQAKSDKTRHRGRALSGRRSSTSRSRQLTVMLISDSLTIIICTLPFALLDAIRPHMDIEDAGLNHLLFSISFYLLYVNRCANFFLYCISGERFRLGLKQICVRKANTYTSNYSNGVSGRRASGGPTGAGTSDEELYTIS